MSKHHHDDDGDDYQFHNDAVVAPRPLLLYRVRGIIVNTFSPLVDVLWRMRYFALPAMIAAAIEFADPLLEISYSAILVPGAPPAQ
jgi:hypothetical protein